jgi:hypothetical protein
MRNIRIILSSMFLLIWQIYIPVHSVCSEVKHNDSINLSCCSEENTCNCCCSHDFDSVNKSKCGECSSIDDEVNSKEFELTKQIQNISILQEKSTLIDFDFKTRKFKACKSDRVIFQKKTFILKSSLLI